MRGHSGKEEEERSDLERSAENAELYKGHVCGAEESGEMAVGGLDGRIGKGWYL